MSPRIRKILSTLTSTRFVAAVLTLLQFVALVGLRFVMSFPVHRDSDDANNFLAGIEMGRGNWNLAGWVMAPDNLYTTDVLGTAILSKIIGIQPFLMRLWEAILWALIIFAGLALSRKKPHSRATEIVTVLTLLALTLPMDRGPLGFITTVSSHASSIFLGLVTFWLASKITTGAVRTFSPLSLSLVLVVFLGAVADPIYVVMACLPVLVTSLTQLAGLGTRRNMLIVCVLSGLLIARCVLALVAYSGGFVMLPLAVSFASFADVVAHFQLALHSIATLFSANFSAKPLDVSYLYVLRFPFFLAFLMIMAAVGMSFLRSLRTWPDHQNESGDEFDFLDKTLFTSVFLSATAAIVTTALVDHTQIRYFLPSAVVGMILVARSYSGFRLFSLYAKLAFVGSLMVAGHDIYKGPKHALGADESILALKDTLQSANLHHGYAGYWQSAILSVLSSQQIEVLTLTNVAGGVSIFRWFTNLVWYRNAATNWQGPIFFVTKEGPAAGLDLSQDLVVGQFGTPDDILHSGTFIIDVYHQGEQLELAIASMAHADPYRVNAPIADQAFKVKLTILGRPMLSEDKKTLTYRIIIDNQGIAALYGVGKYPINLGVQILGSSGSADEADGARNFFRVTLPLIEPGRSVTVTVRLPLDPRFKDHTLRFALVQEAIAWHEAPDAIVDTVPGL